MKKDVKWMKGRLEELRRMDMRMWKLCKPNSGEQRHFDGRLAAIMEALEFIDNLDDPEEPYSTQKLIHDYEYKTGTFDWVTAFQSTLHGERKETEVTKLETLTVPSDLGEWLQSRRTGDSGAYFTTIDELYHYWESVISSPTGSFITDNKKELIEVILGTREYRIEAPLYCALIKGYELLDTDRFYWIYDKYEESVFPSKLYSLHGDFLTEMSKLEWVKLGINDSNADFVRLDGVEE